MWRLSVLPWQPEEWYGPTLFLKDWFYFSWAERTNSVPRTFHESSYRTWTIPRTAPASDQSNLNLNWHVKSQIWSDLIWSDQSEALLLNVTLYIFVCLHCFICFALLFWLHFFLNSWFTHCFCHGEMNAPLSVRPSGSWLDLVSVCKQITPARGKKTKQ